MANRILHIDDIKRQPERCCKSCGPIPRSAEHRFWQNTQKTSDGCWSWHGSRDRDGYGQMTVGGIRFRATHVALTLANHPRPNISAVAMHSCDNPSCVNPAHLQWGCTADNMKDKNAKGRQAFGSRCGAAKLTENDIIEIRSASGSQWDIARRFGVDQSTISDILRKKRWLSVT